MKQYVELLSKILTHGEERKDRTGVGTLSIFGGEVTFNLLERFPLVSIKKTLYEKSFYEMLWFISGDTNIKYLKDLDISIWDDWADENGNLGPVYGHQWRKWPGKLHEFSISRLIKWSEDTTLDPKVTQYATKENCIGTKYDKNSFEQIYLYQEKVDQLQNLIDGIKKNPIGRRHMVTAWNPGYIDVMGLPPCHYGFQCYVSNDGYLDLRMNIRSWDTGLGGPFNISQYALLTHLIARATSLKARNLSISYGDAHIYLNHVDKIRERITNFEPVDCSPQLVFKTENTDIDSYKPGDFEIVGYASHSFLKLPVAV
jgi:thymidylate synthase